MRDETAQSRSRTVTWEDPIPVGEAAQTMAGIDFIRAMAEDRLPHPPICATLDFHFDTVEEGHVAFICTPGEHHYNPIMVVHGGLAATMIDSATGCAVHTTLPAGIGYTTTNLSVDFLRPTTTATGAIRCEGTVVHRGSRLAIAEGRLIAVESGKLLARGQSSCMIFTP